MMQRRKEYLLKVGVIKAITEEMNTTPKSLIISTMFGSAKIM
jgi:hypothetical protein